ncbi:MAG: hypothetical protein IT290_01915, partial [Deltaproteobacteria bacterium]|nr:hypothetical protein [Deltaproteobacteria bacterium]
NDPKVLASTLDVISETLGDVVSKELFTLKKEIEVVVLNRHGDAKVIIHSLYANLTNAPILERRETIWSESPIDGVGLRAYSGDQPVPCLPTTFEPHVKEFALQFATPIQPRETRRYRLEYSISGMFKDRQFYFVRIYPGVVHQTFCLRIDPSLALSSVFVTRQSATDRPTASSSTTSAVEFIEKDGEVRWELYSPRAGSIIRTYWSYA